MLLQMFSSTPWNSKCQSLRSPNQDVLQSVSTTARYDPCRLQGCDVGWLGGIGTCVQVECVCLRLTKKQKLVASQLGWYDVPPTALKIQWIWFVHGILWSVRSSLCWYWCIVDYHCLSFLFMTYWRWCEWDYEWWS